MRSGLRHGAGLALALLTLTCTDRTATGPGRPAAAVFDLSALRRIAPGDPVIPIDSARVTVRRAADQVVLQDTSVALAALDSTGATASLTITVELQSNTENVTVLVTAFGGGVTWYTGTTTTTLLANQTVTPATLTLTYMGPGANADSVRLQLATPRLVGGVSRTLTAVVYVPGGALTGVPVGYRVGNTTVASVSGQALNTATITGAVPIRDSTWVFAETPTHLRDSVWVTVVPPPAQLVTVSGGGQSGPPGQALAAPLVVRVLDQLNGPFWGQAVTWSVVTGSATLSATTTATDSAGYASVVVTPTAAGALTVRATATGLANSPQTFAATGVSAGTIAIVSGEAQSDTIGATLTPFVVGVVDAQNNPVVGTQVAWLKLGGSGTLGTTTNTTDAAGHAQVVYTLGAVPGGDSVRATLVSTGTSVTFHATTLVGAVRSVSIDRTLDTIPKAASLQYNATLRDAQGNVIPGTVVWSSTAGGVASINSSSGLATALGGGYTRIIATSGGFADTADLYVRALTTIAVSPLDTVITAVGDSVQLAATALTNFGDTITTGIGIRWISATPTVATVNAATGRATLIGPGNAVVLARDTISGVQGPATLRVVQVPASVTNTPADSIQVGIGGRGQIVARALDRNAYPIPGKTFGWTTRNASLATVDQVGVVTGVALGQAWVVDSLVDSAGVFKDSTLASVVTLPPAVVQWAYDSVAVGNGGNLQVALTLTRSSPTPLVVQFTWPTPAVDSFLVKPSVRTVTFPANVTASSVTINGLTAGRAELIVLDSTGVYLPDTMVVTVVSTIEFREIGTFNRQPNFFVNKNETHRAQVFLSDPAPPGGLGVTFVYGAPGKSVINPSPAIIPAGQLAADVVIQGLGQGRDSVIPTSGGFVGKYSYVYVASDSLQLYWDYPYTGVLGLGQRMDNSYVAYTYSMDHPLIVNLALSPQIGTVPDTVTIPTGTYYRYFTTVGTALGTATLTASAPGWVSDTLTLRVSTPYLNLAGSSSIVAGDPTRGSWNASTVDSLGWGHSVIDTVTVTAVSRNTNAVVVDAPTGKVLPGNSGVNVTNALRALPTAGGDSAWIVVTAPNYAPDSLLVRVTPPTLNYYVGYPYDGRVAFGTRFQNAAYVQIPYARPDTFWVLLSHSRRGVLGGPDSVAILPGATLQYFPIQGDSLGVDTVAVARATGYAVSGGPVAFKVDSLRVRPNTYPQTLYTISAPALLNVVAVNAVNGFSYPLLAPLTVGVTSGNPAAFTLAQPAVTIPAGSTVSSYDTVRVVAVDTIGARFHTSAAGPVIADSAASLTRVFPTPLNVQTGYPYTISQSLRLPFNYAYLSGGSAPDTVVVYLTHSNPNAFTLLSDSVLILKGQTSSQYFEILASDSVGTDTIFATAAGYVPGKTTLSTQPSQLIVGNPGSNHLTTDAPTRVITYSATRNGWDLKPGAPVTFTIASSNPNVIAIDSAATFNAARDTGTSVVDTSRSYGYFKIRYVGSGSARITVTAPGFDPDSTPLITVTGPSLNFAYTTVTVGQGQVFRFQYAYVNNPVPAPLVVHLLRSDSLLPQAQQAFALGAAGDSVIIPQNGTSSPAFDIIGNAIGSAQLVGRATGYSQAVSTISVGQPVLIANNQTYQLYVGESPRTISVSTYDQAQASRPVAAPLVVAANSSDPTVALPDSATRTIPALGSSINFKLQPVRKGGVDIVWSAPGYVSDTTVVTVDTAKLNMVNPPNGLGPGQVVPTQMSVQLPYPTDSALVVTLQSTNPAVLTVPAAVTVSPGATFAYIPVTGVGLGTASVIASAPHSYPDTQPVVIGTPKLLASLTANTNAGVRYSMTIFSRDSLNNNRSVVDTLTITLLSSDATHTAFDSTTVHILPGQSSVATGVTFDTAGAYTITASASGYTSGQVTSTTTGALVRMMDNFFTPATVTIPAGRVMTWRNDGGTTHTTTEDGATPLWNVSRTPGQVYSRTFSTAGTFTYHCSIHSGMTGTIIVQ